MSTTTDSHSRDERLINAEYKIWKKNTPFLYDLIVTKAFEWPFLTCQWLPFKRDHSKGEYSVEKLILGSHTIDGEQNEIMIAEARIPNDTIGEIEGNSIHDTEREGYPIADDGNIEVIQRISQDGEVNRARYMPQNPFIIATKTTNNDVLVFDTAKHRFHPPAGGKCRPQMRLRGHKMEGYGVSWNMQDEGMIVSGSEDRLICTWDIQAQTFSGNGSIDPLAIYKGHEDVVSDVAWNLSHSTTFGSVGDDGKLLMWDTRLNDRKIPFARVNAHRREVNCISFNPFSQFILATGSVDCSVALWDTRNLARRMYSLENHSGDIMRVEWSPFHEEVLASASADRRVNVWDLGKIGEDQDPMHSEDFPPELLFIHGGHTSQVADISWNPNQPWMMASVANDNLLQVWCLADHIYGNDRNARSEEGGEGCERNCNVQNEDVGQSLPGGIADCMDQEVRENQ